MFLVNHDSLGGSFVGIGKTIDAAAVLVETHFKKEYETGYHQGKFTLKNGKMEKIGDFIEIHIDVVFKNELTLKYSGYTICEVPVVGSRKKNHDFTSIWDGCKNFASCSDK